MLKINDIKITGRPTHEFEAKTLPNSGRKVVEFQIANDDSYFDTEAKQEVKRTQFVNVRIYGPRAEALVKNAPKGKLFYIEGKLVTDEWADKETQEKRSRTLIEANDWQFAEPKKAETAQG